MRKYISQCSVARLEWGGGTQVMPRTFQATHLGLAVNKREKFQHVLLDGE